MEYNNLSGCNHLRCQLLQSTWLLAILTREDQAVDLFDRYAIQYSDSTWSHEPCAHVWSYANVLLQQVDELDHLLEPISRGINKTCGSSSVQPPYSVSIFRKHQEGRARNKTAVASLPFMIADIPEYTNTVMDVVTLSSFVL